MGINLKNLCVAVFLEINIRKQKKEFIKVMEKTPELTQAISPGMLADP